MPTAATPQRKLTAVDRMVAELDRVLRTVCGGAPSTGRRNPALGTGATNLSPAEQRRSGRLLRVDHAGEVSAQALYHGQALVARRPALRELMNEAAREENDHLAWCEQRLHELASRPSYLGPLWYAGSFAIGSLAGAAGDRWSLGFLAETERQVVRHLEGHLQRLPGGDHRSRAILVQMRADEERHATTALHAGAAALPRPVKHLMTITSKLMTGTAYWL